MYPDERQRSGVQESHLRVRGALAAWLPCHATALEAVERYTSPYILTAYRVAVSCACGMCMQSPRVACAVWVYRPLHKSLEAETCW